MRLRGTDLDVRNGPTRRSQHRAALEGIVSAADTLTGLSSAPALLNSDRKTSFVQIHNRLRDTGTLDNCGGESSEIVHHEVARLARQTGIFAKSLGLNGDACHDRRDRLGANRLETFFNACEIGANGGFASAASRRQATIPMENGALQCLSEYR